MTGILNCSSLPREHFRTNVVEIFTRRSDDESTGVSPRAPTLTKAAIGSKKYSIIVVGNRISRFKPYFGSPRLSKGSGFHNFLIGRHLRSSIQWNIVFL